MPDADELPPGLAMLARRQALDLSPSRFDFDLGRLLKVLDRTVGEVHAPTTTESEIADLATTEAGVVADLDLPGMRAEMELPSESNGTGRCRSVSRIWATFRPRASPRSSGASPRGYEFSPAVGVVSAVIVLVIVVIVASSNTDPPAEGVIFSDDFSGRAPDGRTPMATPASAIYDNDTYHVHANRATRAAGSGVHPTTLVACTRPPLRTSVSKSRRGGSQGGSGHGYGILCRVDGINFYALSVGEKRRLDREVRRRRAVTTSSWRTSRLRLT